MAKRLLDILHSLWRRAFILMTPMSYMPLHEKAQTQGMVLLSWPCRRLSRTPHNPEVSS